ncbi:MAG TPA: thioredoxin family protein [Vicinamibacteria bacterium]|nr:thioredoxin family protein [Vicinamibacteria bacterium]
MPGWHEKTKSLQDSGRLQLVGIVEEQHSDRTRLFMQWKNMEWPLLLDSMNLLGVKAVPLTYLVDEHGVVRYERPTDADLEAFLESDYPPVEARPAVLRAEAGSAEHLLLWRGESALDEAIERLAGRSPSMSQSFRLGVAYRSRYDSGRRRDGDFARAVESWARALELDPNQYIVRRRIQQYGPRLDKPYPFYDWVLEARRTIASRGETPVPLSIEPAGAEYAEPVERFEKAKEPLAEPDPGGRILRDEKPLIRIETVTVPPKVAPGETARVHVVMRPDSSVKAHWNNEVDDLLVWVSPVEAFGVDQCLHRIAVPPEAVSQEVRRVEFEVETPTGFSGTTRIPAYALYYVCEDVNGTCLYRRQDIEVSLRAR